MSVYPQFTAGQRLTAALLTAMQTQEILKVAGEPVTSSTALQADDELVVPVLANATYEIEFCLRVSGLTAAGFKTDWDLPAGASGNRLVSGPGAAAATDSDGDVDVMRWTVHASSTVAEYTNPRNSASSHTWIKEWARLAVGGTAGNVTIRWAQLVSTGTATTVQPDSYVRYRRVA